MRTGISMTKITITPGMKCQYEGCDQDATCVALGQSYHPGLGAYCGKHADVVTSEDRDPEYTGVCPNCGCMFGVN